MKPFLLAMAITCAVTQAIYAQNIMNRPMSTDDPNRDPDWVWYDINQRFVTLYPRGYSRPTANEILPFFDNSGPATAFITDLTDGPMDIYPDQGWELVLRDFGTPEGPQDMPFFLLYNKYRGLLRLFYWDPDERNYTRALGTLTFQNNSRTTANMALSFDNATLDNYKSKEAYEQIAVGEYINQTWCFMDFDVSGYDPSAESTVDPKMIIKLYGRDESELVVEGTLDFEYEKGSVTAVQKIGDSYTKAAKRYKGITDAKKVYKEWGEVEPGKWYSDILKGASDVAANDFIPFLGAAAGILDLAIGNGKKAPLLKKAYLKLNGTITQEEPIGSLTFRVPGAISSNPSDDAISNRLPLYDVPLGVFNLRSIPEVEIFTHETKINVPINHPLLNHWRATYHHQLKSFQPVFNPHVFSDIDIELSYQWTGKDDQDRSFSFLDLENFINTYGISHPIAAPRSHLPHVDADTTWRSTYPPRPRPWSRAFERDGVEKVLGVRVTLKPIDSNQKTDLIKAYKPEHLNLDSWYRDDLPEPVFLASAPFNDNFQSGTSSWKLNQGGTNSIRRISESTSDGYFIVMDKGDGSNRYVTNSIDLRVNLLEEKKSDNYILEFQHIDFNDEEHGQDGVFLSVDGGGTFHKIYDYGLSQHNSWKSGKVDLSEKADLLGLTLSPTSIIRFQQYDNFSHPTDGRGIDDVSISNGTISSVFNHRSIYTNGVNAHFAWDVGQGDEVWYSGLLGKESTCNCWNSGASTRNIIPANKNGGIQITLEDHNWNKDFMFGLSYEDTGHSWNSLDFNMYISEYRGHKLLVYNKSSELHVSSIDYNSGDVLVVERIGSTMHFKHNGITFYTTSVDRNRQLVGDFAMYSGGVSFFSYMSEYYDHWIFYSRAIGSLTMSTGISTETGAVTSIPGSWNYMPDYMLPENNLEPGFSPVGMMYGRDGLPDTLNTVDAYALENVDIYPIPVKSTLFIDYTSNRDKLIGIEVSSITNGSVVDSREWRVVKGENQIKYDAFKLRKGQYILTFTSGGEIFEMHILKE